MKYEHWFDSNSFSEVKYEILMKRKPILMKRCELCYIRCFFLCTVTLISFFVTFAQASQIGISILLAFAVFKLKLSDTVPVKSDTISLISIYYMICMLYSLTAMIWFTLVFMWKEKKKLPTFIRKVVFKFFTLFVIKQEQQDENNELIPSKYICLIYSN